MNNLHLQYLRETGTYPLYDTFHEFNKVRDIEDEFLVNGFHNIPKPEYILWLESKLNSL